ncbi:FAD-dependent oxidoreductase [Parabacteroides sp. Marseille-P3160]|uniref:FAD-dependent oxidoreductase n=1 Tax=Parabacteroides sp. Marseille-P3160 TaxID=1917887 RepID=UPI0009B9A703|nr:FAD-dependent oxidoreductase [Parabacteroides sp. Marseille-P3160]
MITRRDFFKVTAAGGCLSTLPLFLTSGSSFSAVQKTKKGKELSADVVITGGGLGGCAAALAALRNGLTVVLTEETDWIGGQITQQGVPPDEHQWIETHGATQLYRDFRTAVRNYYIRNYPLTEEARNRKYLNPGDGWVSRLCHEPRVALAVLYEMLNPYISSGKLTLLLEHKAIAADVEGDKVRALKVIDTRCKNEVVLTAPYFIDATELGDLLPLAKVEYQTGTESKSETKEMHAPEKADPQNQQAFTVCFALDYEKGVDHIIDKPEKYDFWRHYIPALTPAWPGPLLSLTYGQASTLIPQSLGFHPEGIPTGDILNLWNYRRIIHKGNFNPDSYHSDISIINWPQNDYMLGNLDQSEKEFKHHVAQAKQLNLSLLYWLQTEVPRPDGGQGWPGLRLRGDVMGTEDGMAKYPYVRESRRIKALFTILEEHIGKENRLEVSGKNNAADFYDSVGIGYYRIDLHPSSRGNNYIDIDSLPFQVPLGALIPQRIENLLPANKNIGTTHLTNGCYRVHPVEWGIGEAVGLLVHYAMLKKTLPRAVREKKDLLADFQQKIRNQGIETDWHL